MTERHHDSFKHIRTQAIPSLNLNFSEYHHRVTGCVHYHIASEHSENVFLVGLRTVPVDSTGVAHILEHSVLCGSNKFPVRDPFFLMLRRSLNTFMNAFTSSDWTAYPFASQHKKDFNNLLQVYLDAVFFANLDPLDVAQEGHRLEFVDNDSHNALQYKGVVFNEMKGSMSSPTTTLWHAVTRNLFPDVTYHFNSGGDPEQIPELSYEAIKAFYQKHYHPSNAIIMTYGDIPAHAHQENFDRFALAHFSRGDTEIRVPKQPRFSTPKSIVAPYAYDDPAQASNKSHIVLAWLLGESCHRDELYEAEFIAHILLENSASPLLQALETTTLGSAPSPLCGVDDSGRESFFICGLEGCQAEDAEAVETLILDTLRQVVADGVSVAQQHAVLHQLELHHREITGGSMPYGLQLIMTTLTAAIHGDEPGAMLNIDEAIAHLRKKLSDPKYIPNLIQRLFLDNTHRIRLCLRPDPQLSKAKQAAETKRLQQQRERLSAAEKQAIVAQSIALKARQEQDDDPSILPKVSREDIPPTVTTAKGSSVKFEGRNLHLYAQPTNGLVYVDSVKVLPNLNDEQLALLPYYNYCFAELGCNDKNYLEAQSWQSSVSGGIHHRIILNSTVEDEHKVAGARVVSGKALLNNAKAFYQLLQAFEENVRFDELPRIRELIAQYRAQQEHAITQNGHNLAMIAAASGMNATAHLNHRQYGLHGIQQVKRLEASLNDDAALLEFSKGLQQLHQQLLSFPSEFLMVAEQEALPTLQTQLSHVWPAPSSASDASIHLEKTAHTVNQLWVTNTQVNFCAKAYKAVPIEHPDAAGLAVLGGFLRNGYLHRAIREQGGAYGGGAGYDSESASFRFYSYRDPRTTETLAEFDAAVEWLLASDQAYEKVEEAILGVISGMDKPSSPAGEAKKAYYNERFGRSHAQRQGYRQRILDVTGDDLCRVGERYLKPGTASTAIITNQAGAQAIQHLNLDQHHV